MIDLIEDDQNEESRTAGATVAYRETLALADLAFAKSKAVAEVLRPLCKAPIHIVPDGCDFRAASSFRPRELYRIDGPCHRLCQNPRCRH